MNLIPFFGKHKYITRENRKFRVRYSLKGETITIGSFDNLDLACWKRNVHFAHNLELHNNVSTLAFRTG